MHLHLFSQFEMMVNPFLLSNHPAPTPAEKPDDKGAVTSAPFTCLGLFSVKRRLRFWQMETRVTAF